MITTLRRIGLLAALLVSLARPSEAVPAYVTSAVGTEGASTVSITFTGGAGHIGVCGVAFNGTTLTSISDGTTTWTLLALAPTDGNFSLKVAYLNSGLPVGATTMTATFAGTPGFQTLICAEYSGLATSNSFDTSGSNNQGAPGTGGNAVTSSLTTAAANELVVGFAFVRSCSGCAITAGTSPNTFTERQQAGETFYDFDLEDALAVAAGATSVTWTLGTDHDTTSAAVAFTQPVGGNGGRFTLLGAGPGEDE